MGLRDAREQRGPEPEAALGKVARGLVDLGAFLDAGLDELLDLLELRPRVDRADVGVLVERVADPKGLQPILELGEQHVEDRLLDEQARAGAAHVALVEEDAVDHALDRLVERGVLEHDVRGLAAQLEREALAAAGGRAPDRLADLGRARERDLVDGGVDERGAGLPRAGDDVHDAGRELGFLDHLGEQQRRERRRLGGLQHGGVPGGERGRELPGGHQQREVPRDDLARHAHRLRRAAPRERVLELVGPARVVEEVRGRERHVDVARLLDRLAAVHRLEHGELAGSLLQLPRDAEDVLRALRRRERLPRGRGVAGRVDRARHVGGVGLGDLGERLLGRRADRREPPAALRLDELAADEQAVAVLEPHDVGRLGRARVLPRRRRAPRSLDRLAHPRRPPSQSIVK